MPKDSSSVEVRSKIWLQAPDGNPVFGNGRIRILEAIEKHGSISAAARSLGMSYPGAWKRIQATEERLGRQLLEKTMGGKNGGGSELTPFAKELVARFQEMSKRVKQEADKIYEESLSQYLEAETATPPGK